jgi:hypothetical protein
VEARDESESERRTRMKKTGRGLVGRLVVTAGCGEIGESREYMREGWENKVKNKKIR